MSILPKNEPQVPKSTPRNFFIFGATMSGKSYLAEHFPNPLFLNTDGNSEMNVAPSIQLRNIKQADGTLKQSIVKQLAAIMTALVAEKNTYETVIVDVIDDVCVMIEQAVCIDNNVQALSDISYGKGYALFNTILQQFVMELKSLPMNVIYISRIGYEGEDELQTEIPSLKIKYLNIVNGNCDLMIQTKRIGKNYIRRVTDRRKNYQRDQIDDPKILRILDNISGVFDRQQTQTKKDGNK